MNLMARSLLIALFCPLLASNPATASDDGALVTFGCDEVVVVGRVKTTALDDVTSKGDVLGVGRYSMRVAIKRVLRGKETRRVVQASAYAEAQMREGVDFWLVLAPASDGGYVIREGNLTRIPYRLAPACE
jgi:hypothetical protein